MKKNFLLVVICLFILTGCGSQAADGPDTEKVVAELDFFSEKVTDMLNNLNNISLENYELVSERVTLTQDSKGGQSSSNQASSKSGSSSEEGGGDSSGGQSSQGGGSSGGQSSKGEQSVTVTEMRSKSVLDVDFNNVNWNFMKQNIENLNSSWSVAMLDLYNAKVSSDDIMAFEDELNKAIIGIKNEDKANSLANLCNIYSYIPKFLAVVDADKSKQNLESTKYFILTSYAAASLDDWNTATDSLSSAESSFLNVLNDTEYSKNREYKVNKTYMLIKDLQTAVGSNDKNLFFLKYENVMESLNTL